MFIFEDATRFSPETLADELNRCFEDYVVPIKFTAPLVAFLIRVQGFDLVNTLIAKEGQEVAGILVVTRRGDTMRVGGMAVAKAYRGRGLGHELMVRALLAAAERGEHRVILEAVEHNVRAIAFYESCGFRVRHRLISAETQLGAPGMSSSIRPMPFSRLAMLLINRGEEAWSWDMSPGSVLQFGFPIVAFEVRGLGVAVHPVGEDILLCRSMVLSGEDDGAKLLEMLNGLAKHFPNRTFKMLGYFPEPEFQEVFVQANIQIGSLSQVQMERFLGNATDETTTTTRQ